MDAHKQLKQVIVGNRVYLGVIDEGGTIHDALWREGQIREDDLAEWFKLSNCGLLKKAKLGGNQQYLVEDLTVEQLRQLTNLALVMDEAKATAAPQWENNVFDELRHN